MYHYIYKTTLLLGSLAGKYYYGKRSRNVVPENDAYAGSGKKVTDYFKKYGKIRGVTYEKEIIELNPDKRTNAEREREIIEPHLGNPMCLNLTKGGMGGGAPGHVGSMRGKHHSIETRAKISEANKGRTASDETRRKLSIANTGKHPSKEARKKMSEAKIGKTPWNKGGTSWSKGQHFSEEYRAKMSQAQMGHPVSEETRQKISEKNKGIMTDYNKDRMKIVIAVKIDTGVEQEFESINAASRETGVSTGTIWYNLEGITKKSKTGYIFRYKN